MILEDMVFLSQTDTTMGFLSKSKNRLYDIKKRNNKRPFLQICTSLSCVKNTTRVPNKYKNMVRRAKKSTFIYANKQAIRLSKDIKHNRFLDKYLDNKSFFSTSANLSGFSFDEVFAKKKADVVVYQQNEFLENNASSLYKINNFNIKKILR